MRGEKEGYSRLNILPWFGSKKRV